MMEPIKLEWSQDNGSEWSAELGKLVFVVQPDDGQFRADLWIGRKEICIDTYRRPDDARKGCERFVNTMARELLAR